MADEEEKLSEEELNQIKDLMSPLNEGLHGEVLSPMTEQFNRDMEELKPPEPPPEDDEIPTEEPSDVPVDIPVDSGEPPPLSEMPAEPSPEMDLGDLGTPSDTTAEPSDDMDLGDLGAPADTAAEPSDDMDLGDLGAPADTAAEPSDDMDLGDLGDLGAPTDTAAEPSDDMDLGDLGDLGAPTDTAAEPSDDMDLGDLGDLGAPTDTAAEPSDDLDLGDLGDLGAPADTAAEPSADLDLGDLGDLGAPADTAAEPSADLDLGDLGDLGAPADTTAEPSDDMDLGDLGDLGAPADTTAEPSDDMDLGDLGDLGAPTDTAAEPSADLDLGDLGTPADAAAEPSADMDLGTDFDLAPDDMAGQDLDFTGDIGGMDDLDGGDLIPDSTAEVATDGIPDMSDLSEGILDSDDLADMTEKAKLETGIGEDFTDEDLSKIRVNLNDYPDGIKKTCIDIIVNEKISQEDQHLLINMIIEEADPDQIADFIEERLGYRPDTSPLQITKEGVPIIYADDMSPEEIARKRRKAKFILLGAAAAVLSVMIGFGVLYVKKISSISNLYETGLEKLALAQKTTGEKKEKYKREAESYFQKALHNSSGNYNLKYLNRYGIAYMNAGYYEEAFIKIYGKVNPDYGKNTGGIPHHFSAWNRPGRRAPLIRVAPNRDWQPAVKLPDNKGFVPEGRGTIFIARDGVNRTVEIAGAYIIDRLREKNTNRTTLINLARFHSQNSRSFKQSPVGKKYKNDGLAIDYYRLILTLLNKPDDVDAIQGIGRIYYNRKEFSSAARQYNKILEKYPMKINGHAGLLNTYIEMWKKKKDDPRWVIARHRLIQKLGLEEDIPIYIMTKLAGFYIELEEDTLRIKYQVDPVNQLTGLDIKDNTMHLLGLIFNKKEERDEETIIGTRYGEGFYQRGRFLLANKKSAQALMQFQNAHKFDPRNYLAVNAMGEYYKKQMDFAKARQYFNRSLEIHDAYKHLYGSRPEDETLMEGDVGKIYFNLGALKFLRNAGMPDSSTGGFPETRIYPDRAIRPQTEKMKMRRVQLQLAGKQLSEALEKNIKDPVARIHAIYWIGWIDYINGDFKSSLRIWEELDTLYNYNYSDPSLLMARGNSYYYTNQIRAALGNYLKVRSDFERKILAVKRPNPEDLDHRKLFLTLSAAYNNIGAVFEKEYIEMLENGASREILTELEKKTLLSYWNAIETARKVEYDNEIARTNQQLAFKYLNPNVRSYGIKKRRQPLIDDWVSPILPSLSKYEVKLYK